MTKAPVPLHEDARFRWLSAIIGAAVIAHVFVGVIAPDLAWVRGCLVVAIVIAAVDMVVHKYVREIRSSISITYSIGRQDLGNAEARTAALLARQDRENAALRRRLDELESTLLAEVRALADANQVARYRAVAGESETVVVPSARLKSVPR